METSYKPIDCDFYDVLETAAVSKKYVKLHYYTDIREYMTVMSVVKDIYTKSGMEFLVLSSGEEVRLDRIIRIDDVPAPGHGQFDGFSCEC